jgi:hypothetical protein
MQEDKSEQEHKPPKKVTVTVDRKEHQVRPGDYVVSAFKQEVHVDPAKELDQIINGAITPLDDTATITIHGGEVFISHVRTGGAS